MSYILDDGYDGDNEKSKCLPPRIFSPRIFPPQLLPHRLLPPRIFPPRIFPPRLLPPQCFSPQCFLPRCFSPRCFSPQQKTAKKSRNTIILKKYDDDPYYFSTLESESNSD